MEQNEDMAGLQGEKVKAPGFAGELLISMEGSGFRVKVDRMAWDRKRPATGDRCVLAFSAAGNSTEVRAVRAALNVNRKVHFVFSRPGQWRPDEFTLASDPEGYTTEARSLGMRQYHLVAVCQRPGFLAAGTDEALWDHLRRTTTTPIDRRWVKAITRRLLDEGRLHRPNVAGDLTSAIADVDTDYMDACVKDMLRKGLIKVEV